MNVPEFDLEVHTALLRRRYIHGNHWKWYQKPSTGHRLVECAYTRAAKTIIRVNYQSNPKNNTFLQSKTLAPPKNGLTWHPTKWVSKQMASPSRFLHPANQMSHTTASGADHFTFFFFDAWSWHVGMFQRADSLDLELDDISYVTRVMFRFLQVLVEPYSMWHRSICSYIFWCFYNFITWSGA